MDDIIQNYTKSTNIDIAKISREYNYSDMYIYGDIRKLNERYSTKINSILLNSEISDDYTFNEHSPIKGFLYLVDFKLYLIKKDMMNFHLDLAESQLNELYEQINRLMAIKSISLVDSTILIKSYNRYIEFVNKYCKKIKVLNLEIYKNNSIKPQIRELLVKAVNFDYNKKNYLFSSIFNNINYAYPIINTKKIKFQEYEEMSKILKAFDLRENTARKTKYGLSDYFFNPIGTLLHNISQSDWKSVLTPYNLLIKNVEIM